MIHKTSIIDKNAKISQTVKIGPYTFIGPNVEIDDEVEKIISLSLITISDDLKKSVASTSMELKVFKDQ